MATLVLDTNVCGALMSVPNRAALLGQLQAHHEIAVSANTLYELVLGLCRSTEEKYLSTDQERINIALGFQNPQKVRFLDHVLPFALFHGANISCHDRGTGSDMFRDMAELVLSAGTLKELRTTGVKWDDATGRFLKCDVIQADFDNMKHQYRNDVHDLLPDSTTWAKTLAEVVNVFLTDSEATNLGQSLDGLYTFEAWLRRAVKGGTKPENNENDRMDMHQLFYLADPSIQIITNETNIKDRMEPGTQSTRVMHLNVCVRPTQGSAA